MEQKKSYKADLEHRRLSAFLLGMVCVLSLFLIALEYTSRNDTAESSDDSLDDVSQDIEMMPAMQQKDMIAAAPGGRTAGLTTKVKAVDEAVAELPEDKSGDGSNPSGQPGGTGTGIGSATQTGSDTNETTALSPVAVDDKDNPLNFQVIEKLPEFPGGMVEFMKWLTKTLTYPVLAQQQKIQGKVVVAFIINKDGTISDQKVITSVSPELDREALRVVRIMPKWKPGEDHGKPCRTYFTIPINFKL